MKGSFAGPDSSAWGGGVREASDAVGAAVAQASLTAGVALPLPLPLPPVTLRTEPWAPRA